MMGAKNVSLVLTHWTNLPHTPKLILIQMSLISLDIPEPTYWGGWELLAETAGLDVNAPSAKQTVSRYIGVLIDAGAVKRVRRGGNGRRSEYRLTLTKLVG